MNGAAGLLFPGQGAQAGGMGRQAYETSAAARAVFAEADEVLAYPLSTLCFEGSADELRQTRWQQPAILACSLALLAAHDEREAPYTICCVSGHSLGLYSALVAAGALPYAEALRLVALRGDLMQHAADECPGGMVAVLGLDDAEVEEACAAASRGSDLVVAANYNAPGQVVISGTHGALERAITELQARGARKVIHLRVAGPFHSPLMRAAADKMAAALCNAHIRDPHYPVVANSVARFLRSAEEVRKELLGQILAPVCWAEAVRFCAANGVATFVDCGPGSTLAGLVKRIVPDVPVIRLDVG